VLVIAPGLPAFPPPTIGKFPLRSLPSSACTALAWLSNVRGGEGRHAITHTTPSMATRTSRHRVAKKPTPLPRPRQPYTPPNARPRATARRGKSIPNSKSDTKTARRGNPTPPAPALCRMDAGAGGVEFPLLNRDGARPGYFVRSRIAALPGILPRCGGIHATAVADVRSIFFFPGGGQTSRPPPGKKEDSATFLAGRHEINARKHCHGPAPFPLDVTPELHYKNARMS